MKRQFLAICALLVASDSASAQPAEQFVGGVATAVEGLGQGLADGLTAGPAIFVTATGRVALPTPPADAYVIAIEGRSPSAVEAARLRDQRLEATRALAAKYGVSVEIGASSFAREDDFNAAASIIAAPASAPGTPPPLYISPVRRTPTATKVFSAKTSARFRADDARKLPPFLDALTAAGVDSTFAGQNRNAMNIFAGMGEALGFGPVAKIDNAVWDRVSQAAMAEARRQAVVFANAAGAAVGPARQILVLNRNVQGETASVTVAVRFALVQGRG